MKKAKAAVTKAKQQVKAAVKQTKQVVKEKVLPVVKKAAQATKKPTNSSSTKAKTSSVDKNRITSEAELKALFDEHRKTRVIVSDGEPITTLMDKRKVLSAESTATPDGLYPYVMLGSKMTYSMLIEDYLKLSDAKAPIDEQFEAALSLINPVRKVKKGGEVLEDVRNLEKVIEETYGLANNSKKAKDAKTTQKEIDQLGEYVKKHDKGTDKGDDFAKELFVPDEYWKRKAPDNATPGSKIEHYRDYKCKKEKSTVIYDDFGRQHYEVDHADHSMPLDHSVPHLHERKFDDPGYSEKGMEFRYNFFEEKEK